MNKGEISQGAAVKLLQIGEEKTELGPDVLWVSGPINKSDESAITIDERLGQARTSQEELKGSAAFLTSSLHRQHTEEGPVSGVIDCIYLLKLSEVERIAGMSIEKAKAIAPIGERSAEGGMRQV